MTPSSWQRVSLGLYKVGLAASRQSVDDAVAVADRLIVHAADVWQARRRMAAPPGGASQSTTDRFQTQMEKRMSIIDPIDNYSCRNHGKNGTTSNCGEEKRPTSTTTTTALSSKQSEEEEAEQPIVVTAETQVVASTRDSTDRPNRIPFDSSTTTTQSLVESSSLDMPRPVLVPSSSSSSSSSASSSTAVAAVTLPVITEPPPRIRTVPTPPLPPPLTKSFSTSPNAVLSPLSIEPSLSIPKLVTNQEINDKISENENGTTVVSNPIPQQQHLPEGDAVPSTRWQRALGFASLGVGLAWGTVRQNLFDPVLGSRRRPHPPQQSSSSYYVSNEDRLAATLCRMRGAALKLGQMLSLQDERTMVSPALAKALARVRQGADAMPQYQLLEQLRREYDCDDDDDQWRETYFTTFDVQPFAAASLGQVHHATLRTNTTTSHNNNNNIGTGPRRVVVKVQYPGVAESIHSDLRNLSMLVQLSGLAPKGLFLDNIIRVGEAELMVECDYRREAENQLRMKRLVDADGYLRENQCFVPNVIPELCTSQILVSEYAPGTTIDQIADIASPDERNRIGRMILYLTMKELFDWRFMQTDPNWGNFLYDVGSQSTFLIDFGAAREYSKEFVDGYIRIVWASAIEDGDTLMEQSRRMGFLTGEENDVMLRAHRLSGFTVGEPFRSKIRNQPFDFRASRISERLSEHTAVFLRHRLTPPPEEVYTLHRKLAGAYMLCIKLGAKVYSRDILEEIVANHVFEDGLPHPLL